MMLAAAAWIVQTLPQNSLSDNEQRFLLWGSAAMGTALVSLIGVIGRLVLKRMKDDRNAVNLRADEEKKERKELAALLTASNEKIAERLERNNADIWERLHAWNNEHTGILLGLQAEMKALSDAWMAFRKEMDGRQRRGRPSV